MLPLALATCLFVASPGPQGHCFDGTGGPGGDFDWVVRDGEIFFFDTTSVFVIGGPDGSPIATQHAVGGVVDVRNLLVEEGGEIRVMGPKPMRILATGEVVVRGKIDLSGFNAKDVATLNTGNITENGGAGAGGGGRGGVGNGNTTGHTLRGGTGQGPFGLADAGAQGGESGWASFSAGKDARRPGGGGGARFARDQGPGLSAGAGSNGHPSTVGAESGASPAQGGEPNDGAFDDPRPGNDFWGKAPRLDGRGRFAGTVKGELKDLSAGYGGGGGGNAIRTAVFPNPSWNFSSDEKGGGGGGGAGGLHVQALGSIVFGAQGLIVANGAQGATGENTNFIDHVGGTGGSGSGGHVVLESASQIDFTDGGANAGALPRDWITAVGKPRRPGLINFVNPCCRAYSNGGAGGPGVIQLHVPDPIAAPGTNPDTTDIIVPASVAALSSPLDGLASPGALALFPTCDPFPHGSFSWFGVAGQRASFLRLALEARSVRELFERGDELDLGLDLETLELPRRP